MLVVANERSPGALPDRLITAFEDIIDVALFYYVGHGQIDMDDQLCLSLVASRTEANRRAATSLPFQAVRRALLDSSATTKIVILDCCFAGLANRPANTLAALPDDVLDKTAGAGAYTMAASGAYTTAWFETGTDIAQPQTFFTKYFADLVETGIPGEAPGLKLHPLFIRVRDNLSTDRRPIPSERSVDAARDFVFARNAAPLETHQDRDAELRLLTQRLSEAEARRVQEHAEAKAQARLNTSSGELALPPVVKRTVAAPQAPPADRAAEGRAGLDGHLQVRGPSRLVRTLAGHTSQVRDAVFSRNGSLLASAGADKTVRLWDVATGAEVRAFIGHSAGVNGVAFSPDGSLLASAGDDEVVRLWEVATGAVRRLTGHTGSVYGVTFSPDGSLLASAGFTDWSVRSWEVATGAELRSFIRPHSKASRLMRLTALRMKLTHGGWVSGVAFSPDGSLLASAGADDVVRLWEVATGAKLRRLTGHTDVAFSPDGSMLASAGDDKTVRLWDVVTGAEVRAFIGHSGAVNGVAFSPDGSMLASAGNDATVRLWDVATGAELRMLTGHATSVSAVAFSRDGSWLASAGDDHTVQIWA